MRERLVVSRLVEFVCVGDSRIGQRLAALEELLRKDRVSNAQSAATDVEALQRALASSQELAAKATGERDAMEARLLALQRRMQDKEADLRDQCKQLQNELALAGKAGPDQKDADQIYPGKVKQIVLKMNVKSTTKVGLNNEDVGLNGVSGKPTTKEGLNNEDEHDNGENVESTAEEGEVLNGVNLKPTTKEGLNNEHELDNGVNSESSAKGREVLHGVSMKPTTKEGLNNEDELDNGKDVDAEALNGVGVKPTTREGLNNDDEAVGEWGKCRSWICTECHCQNPGFLKMCECCGVMGPHARKSKHVRRGRMKR